MQITLPLIVGVGETTISASVDGAEAAECVVTVVSLTDYQISLTSNNCKGQGYGGTPTVTVNEGKASVVIADGNENYNQGIAVTVALPEYAALNDYSGISFDIQAVGEKIGYGAGSNPFVFELKKSGEDYLQGPGSGENVTIGTYADEEAGELSTDTAVTKQIAFDWTDASEINEEVKYSENGATITFVLGMKGKNDSSYTISNLKLTAAAAE